MLGLADFLDFTAQVEDLHNRVHVWVGGHMGLIPFAAFDPIFWAHHTMIDRLWRLWQLRHGNSTIPAGLLDDALPPFRMTVRAGASTSTRSATTTPRPPARSRWAPEMKRYVANGSRTARPALDEDNPRST